MVILDQILVCYDRIFKKNKFFFTFFHFFSLLEFFLLFLVYNLFTVKTYSQLSKYI